MDRVPAGLDGVRLYLQQRIDRTSKRIALERKTGAAKPGHGKRTGKPALTPEAAARRAYQDALHALDSVRSDSGRAAAVRLAAEELERVKSALARIYEVTQHANHDISEAGDWSIVEGEAETALNIIHEAERNR